MIYISRALKGSSDLSAARELYERVADIVEGLGQDAYVPHKATDPEGNPTIPPGEVCFVQMSIIFLHPKA